METRLNHLNGLRSRWYARTPVSQHRYWGGEYFIRCLKIKEDAKEWLSRWFSFWKRMKFKKWIQNKINGQNWCFQSNTQALVGYLVWLVNFWLQLLFFQNFQYFIFIFWSNEVLVEVNFRSIHWDVLERTLIKETFPLFFNYTVSTPSIFV